MEKKIKKYIYIIESLCCTAEINTSTVLQLKKKKEKERKFGYRYFFCHRETPVLRTKKFVS